MDEQEVIKQFGYKQEAIKQFIYELESRLSYFDDDECFTKSEIFSEIKELAEENFSINFDD